MYCLLQSLRCLSNLKIDKILKMLASIDDFHCQIDYNCYTSLTNIYLDFRCDCDDSYLDL